MSENNFTSSPSAASNPSSPFPLSEEEFSRVSETPTIPSNAIPAPDGDAPEAYIPALPPQVFDTDFDTPRDAEMLARLQAAMMKENAPEASPLPLDERITPEVVTLPEEQEITLRANEVPSFRVPRPQDVMGDDAPRSIKEEQFADAELAATVQESPKPIEPLDSFIGVEFEVRASAPVPQPLLQDDPFIGQEIEVRGGKASSTEAVEQVLGGFEPVPDMPRNFIENASVRIPETQEEAIPETPRATSFVTTTQDEVPDTLREGKAASVSSVPESPEPFVQAEPAANVIVASEIMAKPAEPEEKPAIRQEYNEPGVTLNPDVFTRQDVLQADDARAVAALPASEDDRPTLPPKATEENSEAGGASTEGGGAATSSSPSFFEKVKELVVGAMIAVASMIGIKSDEPQEVNTRDTVAMTANDAPTASPEDGVASTDPDLAAKLKAARPQLPPEQMERVTFNDEEVLRNVEVAVDVPDAKPRTPTLESAPEIVDEVTITGATSGTMLSAEQKLDSKVRGLEENLEASLTDGTKDNDPNYAASVQELQQLAAATRASAQVDEVKEALQELDGIAGGWVKAPSGKEAAYAQALVEAKVEFAEAGAPEPKVEGFVERLNDKDAAQVLER